MLKLKKNMFSDFNIFNEIINVRKAEDKYAVLHLSGSSLANNCSEISCLYNFNNGFNNRISVCQIKMILQQRDNYQGIFYKGRRRGRRGGIMP